MILCVGNFSAGARYTVCLTLFSPTTLPVGSFLPLSFPPSLSLSLSGVSRCMLMREAWLVSFSVFLGGGRVKSGTPPPVIYSGCRGGSLSAGCTRCSGPLSLSLSIYISRSVAPRSPSLHSSCSCNWAFARCQPT